MAANTARISVITTPRIVRKLAAHVTVVPGQSHGHRLSAASAEGNQPVDRCVSSIDQRSRRRQARGKPWGSYTARSRAAVASVGL